MYWPPESGNIDPNSAKAKQAHSEINAPRTHTSRNRTGCGRGPAISFAVRKIDEPIIPLTSSNTESSRLSPRTSVGLESDEGGPATGTSAGATDEGSIYPIPSSSEDSSAVPQPRQMTDQQPPPVHGTFP